MIDSTTHPSSMVGTCSFGVCSFFFTTEVFIASFKLDLQVKEYENVDGDWVTP